MNLYKEIFTKLTKAKINYIIVGGVAVNLYGYSRFTGDIDIIIALDKENLEKVEKLMRKMGYVERLPVSIKEFGDKRKLGKFIKEKGVKAYTFISGDRLRLDIDIIVEASVDFDKYKRQKKTIEVWGIKLPVVDIDDLIDMKKAAKRDKDTIDLEALLKLKNT